MMPSAELCTTATRFACSRAICRRRRWLLHSANASADASTLSNAPPSTAACTDQRALAATKAGLATMSIRQCRPITSRRNSACGARASVACGTLR
ncbi:hypothetical protein NB706_002075 [Xanthomonas sacchari]|nr:hypothetical protein [Xanthomonas sacchari]